jgi:hypothetical protein
MVLPILSVIRPREKFYSTELKEFILRYDDVRAWDQPERMLLDFLQDTYQAAAERGGWDRENLEKDYPAPGEPVDAGKGGIFPKQRIDGLAYDFGFSAVKFSPCPDDEARHS